LAQVALLDGDPAPPTERGRAAPQTRIVTFIFFALYKYTYLLTYTFWPMSMVDIQSPTAEIRRGKKEEEEEETG